MANLYANENFPLQVVEALRRLEHDVLTALEDGTQELDDLALLDRATALGRVLFTRNDDLLTEATRRLRAGLCFGSVIYAHQQAVSIGQVIRDPELITMAGTSEDAEGQVKRPVNLGDTGG